MSYTTAHASNLPANTTTTIMSSAGAGAAASMLPTPTPPVTPAMDRRQVVPLESAGTTAAPPRPAAAYTANLEAQVRVLEQEVQLLRGGLAQNEKLRLAASLGTAAAEAATAKRVRFGPASVVHISPTRQPARAAAAHPVRARSNSGGSRASGGVGADGRPRLAFGQRVDPTQPRPSTHVSHSTAAASGAAPPPAAAPSPASTSAVVELSPASASLRGSNTNGVPLQGGAVGGTLVAPIEAAAAAPPGTAPAAAVAAATVWASADPSHRPWSHSAPAFTTAAASPAATAELARYPFRTAPLATPALPSATPAAPQVIGATPLSALPPAPPQPVVVVAMSSDGPPHAAPALAAATTTALPVPTSAPSRTPVAAVPSAASSDGVTVAAVPLLTMTNAAHAPPPMAVPATTTALPEPPQLPLETEVRVLRDTLAQREALLHRVLFELHDRGSGSNATLAPASSATSSRSPPLRRGSGPAAAAVDEQSRRALRLMAEELLAAQTQLSQARTSYQLVAAELQACRQQLLVAASTSPSAPDAATIPAAPIATAPAAAAPVRDSDAALQAQFDGALKKLKAWEDWYASTAPTSASATTVAAAPAPEKEEAQASPTVGGAEQVRSGVAAGSPQEAQQQQHDRESHRHHRHRRSHSRHRDEDGTAAHGGASSPSTWGCPCVPCVGPPASAAMATGSGSGSRYGVPGLVPLPKLACPSTAPHGPFPTTAAAARPYTTAFALDSALYDLLAQPRGDAASAPSAQRHSNAPAASTPSPPAESPKTADATTAAPQQAASPTWTAPWGGAGAGREPLGWRAPDSRDAPSPYCDRLDHAQRQAYRSQVYLTQLAREAAVRELAEAERLVAEQRLTMWEQQQQQQQQSHASGSGAAAGVPLASTPDGVQRAETVE